MTICLHASTFAAFIGKHPYTKHHEAFEATWKRYSPHTYLEALARHGRQTKEQRLDALRTQVPEIDTTLRLAKSFASTSSTSTDVHKRSDVLRQDLPELSSDDAKLVQEELRKTMFTSYGTTKEDGVLSVLATEMGMEFATDENVLYACTIESPTGTRWKLVGRIDGMTKDGQTILEVKNRMRRLFMKAVEYERIQVECYLRMIQTTRSAMLVESMTNEGAPKILNIITIDRDDALWEECCRRANILTTFLENLVDDVTLQDSYMTCKQPSAFLKSLLK